MTNTFSSKVIRIFKLIGYLSDFPPKTAEKLSQLIDVSVKTVYKDLHLIESLGYETEKDHLHRYSIKHFSRSEYHLDESEKKLIIAVIKEAGLSKTAVTSITQKLKSSTFPDAANFNIMKQLHLIRVLIDAISQKIPLTIKNYKSTTAGANLRDRHVLPLYFDEMRMSVTAYDFEKEQTRIYKVARMTDIIPFSVSSNAVIPEDTPIVDTFGYAGRMEIDIAMLMTRRASSILYEEFMMSHPNISDSADDEFPFMFKSKVCGYEGVGRFVLGMMTEIKVVGDEGFKLYLKNKIKESTLF